MVDISTWCCGHLKGVRSCWRYFEAVCWIRGMRVCWNLGMRTWGGFAARWLAHVVGLRSANCGLDISAHLLSFLQSAAERHGGGGGGGSKRGEVSPSLATWTGCSAAAQLLPGSAVSARASTAAMLKFFSGRDDDNESLLGAVTEGKSWLQRGTGASLLDCPLYGMILRDCAGHAENADAA